MSGINCQLIVCIIVLTSPKSDSSELRHSVRFTQKSDLAEVCQHHRQPEMANHKRSQ